MRRPLLAANWKMHFRAGEPSRYFQTLLTEPLKLDDRDVVVFVPAALLAEAAAATDGTRVAIGAQNIHWEDSGAYTGETSGPMVASAGATHCLVGHSERRHLFGEDDAAVARKLKAAFRNALCPVLCLGERIEERRAGRAEQTVADQVRAALGVLDAPELSRLVIAYDPVWAIGTGETATPGLAAAMHATIRRVVADLASAGVAAETRILYGGSVTPENVAALMAEVEIDGALVGGASLDPAAFRRIVAFDRAGRHAP